MSCFWKPDRPSPFAPDSKSFSPQYAFGNLRSVRQAQFRLRSVVSVQGQYVKTGVQVNHVFLSNVRTAVDCTGILRNVRTAVDCTSILGNVNTLFLKYQIDESIIPQLSMNTKSLPNM